MPVNQIFFVSVIHPKAAAEARTEKGNTRSD